MKFPFGRTKVQKIETTIASLVKRADQLTAKRAKAQEALEKATSARQQALLAGDLDDQRALDKLQAAVDTAGSALTGIDDALAILAQHKAETDAQLIAERDRIERAAAADKLDSQIAAIEAALPGYLEQSRVLADTLSEIGHFHFESDQMASFVQNAMGQIEIAANFTLAELKSMPGAIRQGRQAIPPNKPPSVPVVAEPASPTMTVFMIKSARYRDDDGRTRFAGQFEDVIMPVTTAQKAMRLGLAVSTADPRRATHRGVRNGQFVPDGLDVVDIDAAEEHSEVSYIGPDPVLRAANFQQVDRGPDRILMVTP
jgi:hypothetical protein